MADVKINVPGICQFVLSAALKLLIISNSAKHGTRVGLHLPRAAKSFLRANNAPPNKTQINQQNEYKQNIDLK